MLEIMDIFLVVFCYCYIFIMIFFSDKLVGTFSISRKSSRKFLHAMIGNLPFIIPFFKWSLAPFLVSFPFIIITWLASPYSPNLRLRRKFRSLSELTEEGHHYGLMLYALSYTILVYFFPHKPYIIAVGILPLAYGDSIAAFIGDRYGKIVLVGKKTLEGTVAMCLTSFLALIFSFAYFSMFYQITIQDNIIVVAISSLVITLIELFTPKGFDNISIPLLGVLVFTLMGGI